MGTFAPDGGGVAATWACDGVVGSFEPCDDGVRFVLFDVGFEGIFLV